MKNILIIDDNEEMLKTFKQLLIDEGYHVSTANNGVVGMLLFMRQRFDLVITALNMPKMNGIGVIKRINNVIKVPIILTSTDYMSVEPDDARLMGVNAVIPKSIDDYDFCELVKYCLEDIACGCKLL
jgi:CheY-like chemotaxis protein